MRVHLVVCSVLAVALAVSGAHAQERGRASSPVAGIVTEVLAKTGDKVQRGQVLAKLDDRLARVEAAIAGAKVSFVEADMAHAEAEFKQAAANMQRVKALIKSNAVSPTELLVAEHEVQKTRAKVDSQRAKVLLARLQLKKAEIILDMHVIRSPITGTIARVTRRPGEGIAARELFVEISRDEEKQ